VIRRLMLAQWLPPAFLTGAEALLVPYAHARGFAPGAAGELLAALPAGMLVGDFVVGRFVRPALRERLVVPLILLLGAPLLGLAGRPPLPVAVLLFAVAGSGFAYALGLQRRFLDVIAAPLRGQAFALLSTGLMTLQGLGPLVTGAAAQAIPPSTVIVLAGVAVLLTASAVPRGTASRVGGRPEVAPKAP
jgi:predicted MFS family arabinose efflux permease